MKRSDFLKFLSSDDRDLNKVIQEKGKKPKLINCIIFYDNHNDKKLQNKQKDN